MKKFIDLNFLKNPLDFKNSSRSDKAKKNITILFFLHVLNFFSIMAVVPISINYLGKTDYGIWLTLASILSWVINLDFGIGNGLRNKLAEALALNNQKLARIYVSTAYIIFGIGIFCALLFYLSIHGFLNWSKILQAPNEYMFLLNSLALWVIILFLVQFFLKLITSIINAYQKPALNGALSLIVNFSTLISIYVLSKSSTPSLFSFSIICSAIPVAVFAIVSLFLFNGNYSYLKPSFRFLDLKYSRDLVKLGMQFFIVQVSALIIFSTDTVIVSQLYGPEEVTTYNVAYKYFYMVPLVFNVVLAPFWSAFTDAFVKKEFDWIRSTIKKLVVVWGFLSLIAVIMIIAANTAYYIWVGPSIKVPFSLSVTTGIFVIIANWNNIFAYFMNGVGKVKLQLIYGVIAGIINIPLSVFLAKYLNLGTTGVILATNICLIFATVLMPIQYRKILNFTARGIWNE